MSAPRKPGPEPGGAGLSAAFVNKLHFLPTLTLSEPPEIFGEGIGGETIG